MPSKFIDPTLPIIRIFLPTAGYICPRIRLFYFYTVGKQVKIILYVTKQIVKIVFLKKKGLIKGHISCVLHVPCWP